ncbi:amino acid/amide ABC transporter substrate-binding protein, HAAT family [Desulfatibacillum alkenivorans DSM 16219]|jgi:branched-chain amino acid transport system substrate-binding protein|uniref:Amino acid/amide ABC transporter substrate-binding protein, HAAT family n=1 Tax=Desulfatibacillum alkenivorans DSM 16219 TaxID=1121393 RepID=A0A1M6QP36_9BACT|nr:ABC transporter substrate-binding protein [Desulfatibacillum alkenivorans]SHK22052.1 amino acid/amide ABC transporter substrate-binding protein, HAAT family [Desulfatibacillum alkenivorans DSM 16219]
MTGFQRFCAFVVVMLLFQPLACNRKNVVENPLRIGVLFPMSGSLEEAGLSNLQAIRLAVEKINSGGGVRSMGGQPLELVYGDTRGQSLIAAREAERLISEEGVLVIIGAYQSSAAEAAAKVCERLGAPIIISSGMADIITDRGFQYTFRLMAKAEHFGRDMVSFLLDFSRLTNRSLHKTALLYENTAYGTACAFALKKHLTSTDLEIAGEVSYRAAGVVDMTQEVEKALDAKPDAILTAMYDHDSLLAARAMEASGMDIPLVNMGATMISRQFVEELGPAVEKYFGMTDYSKLAPYAREINQEFKARFHKELPGECALAYQSVWVIKDALERIGTADKKQIRDALAATYMLPGPDMILSAPALFFEPSGQAAHSGSFVVQVQDGETAPVWPPEYTLLGVRWKGRSLFFTSSEETPGGVH